MPSTITDRLNGLTTSTAVKPPCRLKTTANHSLSGLAAVDGVVPAEGDRILVGSQTDPVANGVYKASSLSWTRFADFDGSLDAIGGTQIYVLAGSTNINTYWRVAGEDTTIAIGTDAVTFEPAGLSDAATHTFLQAGTGAVARTVQDRLRDTVSVKDFGAVGDGATDDIAAFTAAVAALPASGGTIHVPRGTYLVTSTIDVGTKGNVVIQGAGRGAVTGGGATILFAPTANDTLFHFGGGATPTYQQGICDLSIISNDTTYAKIAVHLEDCSEFHLSNCNIGGGLATANGLYTYWFGGAGGSIAIKTNGRDLLHVTGNRIAAQRNMVWGCNANHPLSADSFKIIGNYFLGSNGTGSHATAYPIIEVVGQTTEPFDFLLQNVTIADNNFIGGSSVFKWDDSANALASNDLVFLNNRAEQTHSLTDYEIYLNSNLRHVTIKNWYGGIDNADAKHGLYIRNVEQLTLIDWSYVGADAAKNALNVDSSVSNIAGHGCMVEAGAAISITGQRYVRWGASYPSSNVPQNFVLQTTLASVGTIRSDYWQSGSLITLANAATHTIGTVANSGILFITNNGAVSAIFAILGTNNLVQEISDPSGQYSITAGTGSSTNLYVERSLAFTAGLAAGIVAGNTITGATSGATAVVAVVTVTSGAFATNDAAGTLTLHTQSGTFQAAENLQVGGTNRATASGNSTATNYVMQNNTGGEKKYRMVLIGPGTLGFTA